LVVGPCFDDNYPKVSADVLLEGTRERAERRGLLWMALDVITFVITFPFMASVWKRSIRKGLLRVLGIKLDGSGE
jgi:hypothetical protein